MGTSPRDGEGLTRNMRNMIQTLMMYPQYPDTKCCELVGVSYNTFREWKKDPYFRDALNKRLAEQWEDARRTAQSNMIDLANDMNFNANKYILDSAGMSGAQKVEVSAVDGFTVEIVPPTVGDK